ncbi:MAG TPA: AAA domain-containing protein [Polyangiales bacterium]|nr:AAA domain-containing protein [Polyangiales bacterium]
MLRYWRASLQLEEALSARPRARRASVEPAPVRLDAPSFGHEYFKVPLDDALESLLFARRTFRKAFDPELGAFFENWLATVYRRAEDDRDLSHMLAFPVVHLPRGELAGLLRYAVRVHFGAPEGPPFRVPTRGERRQKQFPPPPSEARLVALERGGQRWPFFLDTRLLHQQLGVARENIDGLFDALRERPEVSERDMLALVCRLLEAELAATEHAADGGEDSSEGLLQRITAAMSELLARRGTRARVYPVGIVVDATRAKTTWYLQRELEKLLEEPPDIPWDLDSSLGSYLTGGVLPPGAAVQRALFPGPPLSPSQRAAAERCWGSRLLAVQGPPGTGKTTTILHLAAESLVRQVDSLVDKGTMGAAAFVVTSTNNRAVDNVVDPLIAQNQAGLPLALRAGSQRVCEAVLAPQLARAREWLDRARKRPAPERALELDAALARFVQLRARVTDSLAARSRALEAQTRREWLQFEISRLVARSGETLADGLDSSRAAKLRAPLEKARKRVKALCELCEATPGIAQLSAVDRHFRSSEKKVLPALAEALASAGLSLDLGLPPNLPPSIEPAALMDVWAEAADTAFGELEALQERVDRASKAESERGNIERLRRELNALGPLETAAPPNPPIDDAAQQALFEAAVAVRDAWAAAESETLYEAVTVAFAAASGERSLRTVWDRGHWRSLRQLFGVWGCTLLSLGNCFPAQRDAIERLVIDEAGQCHPAFAVSGLLRCESALIIGDVHQLEPVIELEADDDLRVIESSKLSIPLELLAPYRVHGDAHTSVQSLADRAVAERLQLNEHFRCQPEIIAICDRLCDYGLSVQTVRAGPAVPAPFLLAPVTFVDVAGEQERLGGSWQNSAELALTLELFQALMALGTDPNDVAVITPYRGQLEQLRKQFHRLGIPIDYSVELADVEDVAAGGGGRGVALGTVHRFQGGERSIVLFSSVVTRRTSLGFLDERENLLNVAVSRARHRFVVFGNRAVLASGRRTSLVVSAAEPLSPEAFRRQLGLQL